MDFFWITREFQSLQRCLLFFFEFKIEHVKLQGCKRNVPSRTWNFKDSALDRNWGIFSRFDEFHARSPWYAVEDNVAICGCSVSQRRRCRFCFCLSVCWFIFEAGTSIDTVACVVATPRYWNGSRGASRRVEGLFSAAMDVAASARGSQLADPQPKHNGERRLAVPPLCGAVTYRRPRRRCRLFAARRNETIQAARQKKLEKTSGGSAERLFSHRRLAFSTKVRCRRKSISFSFLWNFTWILDYICSGISRKFFNLIYNFCIKSLYQYHMKRLTSHVISKSRYLEC